LNGKHGADLRAVKNIEKKGLDDIVLMMTKGNFIAIETLCYLEDPFPPFPGTEKTGILPVLRTVGKLSDLGLFDMVRQVHSPALNDSAGRPSPRSIWIGINLSIDPLSPLSAEMEQRELSLPPETPTKISLILINP
jgi:hypothetical protein